MKRRVAVGLALAVAPVPTWAAPAPAPAPIAGRWLTVEGKAIVEIGPCQRPGDRGGGGQLCGRLARIMKYRPGGPRVDANNPDKGLRDRPLQGLAILTGFVAAGDRWKGRVYDPESGRSYRSELVRDGATLHVKGCFGPFCRTQDWTRDG